VRDTAAKSTPASRRQLSPASTSRRGSPTSAHRAETCKAPARASASRPVAVRVSIRSSSAWRAGRGLRRPSIPVARSAARLHACP
jgi:hypothetical protein